MTTSARRKKLTAAEVLALPAMPSVKDSFAAMGISDDLGYALIKADEMPIEVVKFGGRALRVRRSDLLAFLRIDEENNTAPGVEPGAEVEQTTPTSK